MRQLETSSLSDQNISAFLLAHTYTADADRAIFARIHVDQVAGGGDYQIYATIQAGGAGSAFMEGPISTFTVPAAITAIGFVSILVPVNSGDVVKFYVKGLPGDTTTPDIVTRIFELTYLRPTTAGRTLDVAATGEAGVDLDNIKDASAPKTLTNITVPVVTTLSNLPAVTADWLTAAGVKADAVTKLQAGLALEASLTAIKGAGWSTETLAAIDVLIDAIKAKTDNLPASPAATGAQMDLVNAPNATAVTAIQNGLSKPGTAQTITPPADMALNSTVAKDATVSKPGTGQTIVSNADIIAIKAKTDNLPASPAAVGSAMILSAAYDHAKDDVITPLAVVDGVVDAVKLKTDLIPASPAAVGSAMTLANDAVSAAALKADAVTEIQSVLATTVHVQEVEDKVDSISLGAVPPTVVQIRQEMDANSTKLALLDAAITTRMPAIGGTAAVLVVGPVAAGGDIEIVSGDDYFNADGRALEWSSADWPNLTGATVTFETGSTSIAMTVITGGVGITQVVRLELTKLQTAALKGGFAFDVDAVLTGAPAHEVTLVRASGSCK